MSYRVTSIFLVWFVAFGVATGLPMMWPSEAVHAQSTNDMVNRVKRLEAEISDLQRHLFAGKSKPAPVVSSTSVQETALTPKPGANSAASSAAARNEIRLQQLEAQMRNLTGKVEELDFKVTQFVGRIDTLVADLDSRFAILEKATGKPGKPVAAVGGLAGSSASDPATGGLYTGTKAATQKPGVLGYLNQKDLRQIEAGRRETQPKTAAETQQASVAPGQTNVVPQGQDARQTAPILPEGDSATRYKHAFSYLMRRDYDAAESAFREFVDGHGDDALAGNAMYWLGETYYVREMFAQAAVTFAEGYEKYPGSPKTADNLLKLGFSLARLKRTEDACVALAQLSDEFPNASATIKRRAQIEGKRIECKG
ncbi:MAG: tol-pal system protein YbgF [Alphaproteobacteria bacterium]|nr:tol-pal system protein YbgF [Alphaproteobacteria bacterium]